jgi:hypothetical protein
MIIYWLEETQNGMALKTDIINEGENVRFIKEAGLAEAFMLYGLQGF